jgi:hypothetical protein
MITINLLCEQDVAFYDVLAHVEMPLQHWVQAVGDCAEGNAADKVSKLRYILKFLWARLSWEYHSPGNEKLYLSSLQDTVIYGWVSSLTSENTLQIEEVARAFPGILRTIASRLNTEKLRQAGATCPLYEQY